MKEARVFPDLPQFIASCPSPWHAAAELDSLLQRVGFFRLDPASPWKIEPGKDYFVNLDNRAILAFRVPNKAGAMRLVASHLDSPSLRIRTRSVAWEGAYLVSSVEPYGSPILSSWQDRPLEVSGAVCVADKHGQMQLRLIRLSKLDFVVPQLAIHFNRDVNKGQEINPHTALRAVLQQKWTAAKRERPWEELCASELDVDPASILSMDLYLCPRIESRHSDAGDLVALPRIDNLAGVLAGLEALCDAGRGSTLQVFAAFDHEEIGSKSERGADSIVLYRALRRAVVSAFGSSFPENPDEYFEQMLANSLQLSIDAAHARHPAFPEKHDPAYAPILGLGPALKKSVNFRYATQIQGEAIVRKLAESGRIPLQEFQIRSDIPGGSTLGPIVNSFLGIPGVDIGIPILSMHSACETASLVDQAHLTTLAKKFLEDPK